MGARTILICLVALGIVTYVVVAALQQRKGSLVFLSLGLVVMAMLTFQEHRFLDSQKAMSAAVADVSGNEDGYAVCQRFTPALLDIDHHPGRVSHDKPNEAFISYETCRDFRSWYRSDKEHPTLDEVIAVHVLTHEAIHVGGEFNEAVTECQAIQQDAHLAEFLGATSGQATALAKRYFVEAYPEMRDEYVTPDCGEDKPLDESPGDGSFP